jgi:PTH1 family peptidyl-tRNA hydrolase
MRRVEKLVVGLGNPGPKYESTRHNAGFRVVDRVARRSGAIFEPARELEGYDGPRDFEFARLGRDPGPALLVKPRTFMNLSGDVVAPLLASRSLAPEDLLVVYDDLDLPLGAKRIRPHGGPGTHNGMRSIVDRLATDRFPRLRLGIGSAGTDAARHVLEAFTEDEEEVIGHAVDEAADAILFWLATGDLEACMTRFHSRWKEGDESRPQRPDRSID